MAKVPDAFCEGKRDAPRRLNGHGFLVGKKPTGAAKRLGFQPFAVFRAPLKQGITNPLRAKICEPDSKHSLVVKTTKGCSEPPRPPKERGCIATNNAPGRFRCVNKILGPFAKTMQRFLRG